MSEEELKQMDAKISKELQPFLDGIRTKHADYELFKKAYNYSQKRGRHAVPVLGALLRRGYVKPHNQFIEDLIELFAYMGFVEILGNLIVNIIVMLFVANGRDFHIECRGYRTPRIKHAISIEKDLEQEIIPLGTKLNFLRDNGITELTSVIDSRLRNDIAHMKFSVRFDRTENTPVYELHRKDRIYIKGKLASEIASNSSQKLTHAYLTTWELIEQLAKAKGLDKKEKTKV